MVLGTEYVCPVFLAEKSQLNTCQAGREQIIIKEALFPCVWGGVTERGKISQHPMLSDVTLEKPHPIYSYFFPHGNSFTSYLPDSQVLQLSTEIFSKLTGKASLRLLQKLFHKLYRFALLVRRLKPLGTSLPWPVVSRKLTEWSCFGEKGIL